MSFSVSFYSNTAPNNVLNKTDYLTHQFTVECTFKDSCDVTDPVIVLSGVTNKLISFNYAYIPEFRRFYYVNNVVVVTNDIYEVYMECDVLYTYKDNILQCEAFVDRCEIGYSPLIIDHQRPVYCGESVVTQEIPNQVFTGLGSVLITGFTIDSI